MTLKYLVTHKCGIAWVQWGALTVQTVSALTLGTAAPKEDLELSSLAYVS